MEVVKSVSGAVVVEAGAGSGKTTTVVLRIGHLMIDHGVKPENQLITTYTKDAATSMQKKIYEVTGKTFEYVSTIHAFCVRLMKRLHPELKSRN